MTLDRHGSRGGPVVTRVGPALVVILPRELDDVTLHALRGEVLDALRRDRSRALVLEASGLDLVDTHDVRELVLVARAAALLGVRPLLVGLSAGIVAFVVDAAIDMRGLEAFATLDDALHALGAVRWSSGTKGDTDDGSEDDAGADGAAVVEPSAHTERDGPGAPATPRDDA